MPVDRVTLETGPLHVLPRSHLDSIEPPVDFWKNDFVDTMVNSKRWIDEHVEIPLDAGDAIIFDSRLWHGSPPSKIGGDRFAIVSRWNRVGFSFEQVIPSRKPDTSTFGMWTAGEFTKKGLEKFNGQQLDSCNETVDLAINKLLSGAKFSGDVEGAVKQLSLLKILNMASQKHNAGDSQGVVYPNIWSQVLRFL